MVFISVEWQPIKLQLLKTYSVLLVLIKLHLGPIYKNQCRFVSTLYPYATTAALTEATPTFQSAFQANLGLTRLCDINFDLSPQKWGDVMLESYRRHGDGKIPDYVSSLIRSPMRKFPVDKIFGDQVERFVGVVVALVLWLGAVEGCGFESSHRQLFSSELDFKIC